MVVLNCADIIAVYTMWVLMTYLTDVWKLSITHAAAIVNGLSLLVMSTPPVLSKVTGTCSAYEPACIGKTQSKLFYVALALIAVGKSSHSVSKDSFREENKENYSSRIGFRHYAVIVFCVAAIISVAYIKPCGIVISVGNTYFLEQANHLNNKLGSLHLPVEFLLAYQKMAKCSKDRTYKKLETTAPAAILALVPLLNSVWCCITAALVESKRLQVVKKYGLIDKPEATIPMSIFWMIPQMSFLGTIEDSAEKVIANFCAQEVPDSMKRYLPLLTDGVLGAGTIGSVLSVYIVNRVSKIRG
ncbi:hypothetical protein HHK36_022330 [Tetracentron sinense]|uniref:Uncharacterized protein n=1 Tax=Tetracentron sinense TaxID=13715 RepID=A0A834YQN7_TETSI|nr:hypothetical protein HHK36_022330 [Tetracentron sinense]